MLNRNRRTIFLAVLASAALGWSAVYHFDVPVEEMAWLLLYSFLGVLFIVVAAACFVASLVLLKRVFGISKRNEKEDNDQAHEG